MGWEFNKAAGFTEKDDELPEFFYAKALAPSNKTARHQLFPNWKQQQEGARRVTRQIDHFNLDAVISVGYRVNSARATRFRQWATRILREHLTQGYTLTLGFFIKLKYNQFLTEYFHRPAITCHILAQSC